MKILNSVIALSALISVSAMASTLECTNISSKNSGCFLSKSKKLTVEVSDKEITLNSGDLKNVHGTFEKTITKTANDLYSSDDLVDYAGDQTDLRCLRR